MIKAQQNVLANIQNNDMAEARAKAVAMRNMTALHQALQDQRSIQERVDERLGLLGTVIVPNTSVGGPHADAVSICVKALRTENEKLRQRVRELELQINPWEYNRISVDAELWERQQKIIKTCPICWFRYVRVEWKPYK